MAVLLRDVFTPGGLPSVTYVSRDHLELEAKVSDALARGFAFNVVTGPTKSGKTVLCRRVLEAHRPVFAEGGRIRSEGDFWDHIAYQLNVAATATTGLVTGSELGSQGEVEGGFWGLLRTKVGLSRKRSDSRNSSLTYSNVRMLASIEKLLNEKRALLIDDFHYIDSATQKAIIRSLKAAVFEGLPVFLLAVPHRAFDPLTVESEVEGRFRHIAIPRWAADDLLCIPRQGFPALNIGVERAVQRQICEDAFGNPLLVQEICTEFCLKNGVRQRLDEVTDFTPDLLEATYRDMAESKGFPTYERLKRVPKGGRSRQLLKMNGGATEDIATATIASVARLGPKGDTSLDEIRASLSSLVMPETALPTLEELQSVLSEISRTARDSTTGEPPVEWMEQDGKLIIIDPFLLFYLKWTFKGYTPPPVRKQPDDGEVKGSEQ